MTVTAADNHRDRIGEIESDCSSVKLKVTVAVSEMEKKKVIGTVIEIMTETVTTALIETATQGLTKHI